MMTIYDFLPESLDNLTMGDVVTLVYENEDDNITRKLYEFLSQFFDGEITDLPTMDVVIEMILSLPDSIADDVYEDVDLILRGYEPLLQQVADDEEDLQDVQERVTRFMQRANLNHKKRKFMTLSVADLIATKSQRKADNIKNRSKRRQQYVTNKPSISGYQKSRREMIKKGQHFVKQRRKV